MAKLRKTWGYVRCVVCRAFTQAKYPNCQHCNVKHKVPK